MPCRSQARKIRPTFTLRASLLAFLTCAAAFAQQPRIDSVSPTQGPIAGGTSVSFRGSNLAGSLVKLDGALVTPLAQSDTEIRIQMPPHDNGYAIVSAIGAGGTAYGRYLYVPPRLEDLPPGYITTIAGVGAYNGQYGPATAASLSGPWGMAFSPSGLLYFADTPRNRIMRINAGGILEIVAGDGLTRSEPSMTGTAPATSVSISFTRSIAFDSRGNLIVPDSNYYIWRIDPNGMAEQIAGTGMESSNPVEGVPAKGTPVGNLSYVVVDRDDNIYYIDWTLARIRRIDRNGILATYAGNGTFGFSGDGGPATGAQFRLEFSDQGGLALDSAGNVYLLDYGNKRIRRITKATGVIDTFAGPVLGGFNINDPRAIALDANDALYVANATQILRRNGDGTITQITGAAGFSEDGASYPNAVNGIIQSMLIDPAGNVVYADNDISRIRRIDRVTRTLTTIAGIGPRHFGEGEAAVSAAFIIPNLDLDFLRSGELLIADADRMYTIGGDGRLMRYAGSGTGGSQWSDFDKLQTIMRPNNASVSSDGTIDYTGGLVFRIDPDNMVRVTAAKFAPCGFSGDGGNALDAVTCQPWDALRDASGNMLFADTNNNRIRRVDRRSGIITTIAGSGPPNGLERYGFGATCGDGGRAVDACINTPYGLELDPAGNLYVCENELRIRKIDTSGIISTLAEVRCTKLTWAFGNLYTVASEYVARVSPTGVVTQLTERNLGFSGDGGPATAAHIFAQKQGHGVAVDKEGNLFFADGDNLRIRAIRYGAVIAPPGATITLSATGSTIRATVFDAAGHPAPSVRVDFTAPPSGPSCRFGNGANAIGVVSDQNGVAMATCTPACFGGGTFVVTARPLTANATASVTMADVAGPCRGRAVRH